MSFRESFRAALFPRSFLNRPVVPFALRFFVKKSFNHRDRVFHARAGVESVVAP